MDSFGVGGTQLQSLLAVIQTLLEFYFKRTSTFLFEVGKSPVAVGLMHVGIHIDAVGVVGNGLVVIFAFDGFIAFHSIFFCSLLFPLLCHFHIFVLEVFLEIIEIIFIFGFRFGFDAMGAIDYSFPLL